MKKVIRITIVLALFIFVAGTTSVNAQCKSFAKKISKEELGAYTHDGNYHAAILTEGEEAELYKTFYSDQEYRLTIFGNSNLPPIEFKILDSNKNVLYSNKDDEYAKTWDFKLEASQQLKLVVKVTTFEQGSDIPASGCVAIVFGFKVK